LGVWLALACVAAAQRPPAPRVPTIETLAPGAFESGPRLSLDLDVDYDVRARVFIPLGFVSVPIASRDDVGRARFRVRDLPAPDSTTARLRAQEFFATSIPERARGLHRLGFIRELIRRAGPTIEWTAQFGVISTDRADSREAAEATLAAAASEDRQWFDVIDALIETDPYGNFLGQGLAFMPARDRARLGNLYLQDGVWNG